MVLRPLCTVGVCTTFISFQSSEGQKKWTHVFACCNVLRRSWQISHLGIHKFRLQCLVRPFSGCRKRLLKGVVLITISTYNLLPLLTVYDFGSLLVAISFSQSWHDCNISVMCPPWQQPPCLSRRNRARQVQWDIAIIWLGLCLRSWTSCLFSKQTWLPLLLRRAQMNIRES